MLGDDNASAPLVQLVDYPVGIECFVGDQGSELYALYQRGNADCVVALAREEVKPDQVAQSIGQRENLRRPAAFGFPYGLALSPPFAP